MSTLAIGVLIASVFASHAAGAPGDATATGVADINPGPATSTPDNLTNVNGTLFFSVFDAGDGNGPELWKSDGTPAGTTIVEDAVPGGGINPGAEGSYPAWLTDVDGTLFFQARDGTNGYELWKSDGTPAGTMMIEDGDLSNGGGINPGAAGSNPGFLTDVNGTVFFQANDGTNGSELWKSDGTPAGTMMIEDGDLSNGGGGINPGANGSGPGGLTNVNGTVFFSADDGTNGRELWKSDGTPAGTMMVEDIRPGIENRFPLPSRPWSSSLASLTNVNGTLFFSADDGTNGPELWKSDGTPAGTTIVEDAVPGGGINPGADGSYPAFLTDVNGTLFLRATDFNGAELWRSDGTPVGTRIVEDAVPGGGINHGTASSNPAFLTDVNGTVFFQADDGTNGDELWKSDGTPAGTTIVEDADLSDGGGGINPGAPSSDPAFLTDVNGTLFAAADDGTNGVELWKSDGTPAGTTIVEDAVPGGGIFPGTAGSYPAFLTDVDGTLFFALSAGYDGIDAELWKATIEPFPPPTPIPGPSLPPPASTTESTGQRAAALKKCKKKKSATARKKCKKQALKLPI